MIFCETPPLLEGVRQRPRAVNGFRRRRRVLSPEVGGASAFNLRLYHKTVAFILQGFYDTLTHRGVMNGTTPAERRRAMVQEIIKETELPRALLARLAGVNEATLWSWLRQGQAARAPRPESTHRLAAGLKEYAGKLTELAERLEKEGGENG